MFRPCNQLEYYFLPLTNVTVVALDKFQPPTHTHPIPHCFTTGGSYEAVGGQGREDGVPSVLSVSAITTTPDAQSLSTDRRLPPADALFPLVHKCRCGKPDEILALLSY